MIQCKDCELFSRGPNGELSFQCDPFGTVKEPECLQKWLLIKTNQMAANYQATLDYYRKLAPMQEKMFKVMERELDDMNDAESWKIEEDDEGDHGDHGETGETESPQSDWPDPGTP